MPTEAEKEAAFHAHLLGGLGALVLCGMVFPVVLPLVPYSQANEKTPFMLYHVNQAVIFQAGAFVLNMALATVGGILALVCVGYLLLMLIPIVWLISAIYPISIAFAARRGVWVEYPIIGRNVLDVWNPLFK